MYEDAKWQRIYEDAFQENNDCNDLVLGTTPILKISFQAGYLVDEGKYWCDVMVGPEEHHVKSLSSMYG